MKNKDLMSTTKKRFTTVCIVFLTAITPLYGQGEEWPYSNSFEPDKNDPRYFDNIKTELAEYFKNEKYSDIIWYLKDDFVSQDNLWKADSLQQIRNKFINAIDFFSEYVDSVFVSREIGRDKIPGALFLQSDAMDTPSRPLRFFARPEFRQFEIAIDPNIIPPGEAEDLRYRINTLQRTVDHINKQSRLDLQRDLNRLNKQWKNFHFASRSQYPWEFIANNLIIYRSIRPMVKPPGYSLILLHPNASISLDFTDSDHLRTHQTLSLEVIGGALYFRNYNYNAGLSYLFTVNNQLGNGHGVMVSFNNFKMGTAWHKNGTRKPNLLFSLDLFKLFGGGSGMLESLRD